MFKKTINSVSIEMTNDEASQLDTFLNYTIDEGWTWSDFADDEDYAEMVMTVRKFFQIL